MFDLTRTPTHAPAHKHTNPPPHPPTQGRLGDSDWKARMAAFKDMAAWIPTADPELVHPLISKYCSEETHENTMGAVVDCIQVHKEGGLGRLVGSV